MGIVVIGLCLFVLLLSLFCHISFEFFIKRILEAVEQAHHFSYVLHIYYFLLEDKRNLVFLVNQTSNVEESFEWNFDCA